MTTTLEESLDSLYSSRSLNSRSLDALPSFSPPMTTSSRSTGRRRWLWKKSASAKFSRGGGPAACAGSDGGSVEQQTAGDSASLASAISAGRNRPSSFRFAYARRFASRPTMLFKISSSRAPEGMKKIVDEGPSPFCGKLKMTKEQVATTPSLPISTISRQTPQHQSHLLSPLTPFTTADAASPAMTDVHVASDVSTSRAANSFTNQDASPTKVEAETPKRIEQPAPVHRLATNVCKIVESAEPATLTAKGAATTENLAYEAGVVNNDAELQSAFESLRRNLKELRQLGNPPGESGSAVDDADGEYDEFLQILNYDDTDGSPTHLEARKSDDYGSSSAALEKRPDPEENPDGIVESTKEKEEEEAEDLDKEDRKLDDDEPSSAPSDLQSVPEEIPDRIIESIKEQEEAVEDLDEKARKLDDGTPFSAALDQQSVPEESLDGIIEFTKEQEEAGKDLDEEARKSDDDDPSSAASDQRSVPEECPNGIIASTNEQEEEEVEDLDEEAGILDDDEPSPLASDQRSFPEESPDGIGEFTKEQEEEAAEDPDKQARKLDDDGPSSAVSDQRSVPEESPDEIVESTKEQDQEAVEYLEKEARKLNDDEPSSAAADQRPMPEESVDGIVESTKEREEEAMEGLDKEARKSDDGEPSPAAPDQRSVPDESPYGIVESIKEPEEKVVKKHPPQMASIVQESVSTRSDESFADGGGTCHCLWCPETLLGLLRGGGFRLKTNDRLTLSPLVLPPQRKVGDGTTKEKDIWQSVESLRAALEAMAEGHARAAPLARADPILREIRVIERSLDKIAALLAGSAGNSW